MWSRRLFWKLAGLFVGVWLSALLTGHYLARPAAESFGLRLLATALIAAVATSLAFWIVRSVRRPLADVSAALTGMQTGGYQYPVALATDPDHAPLAVALSRIATDLADRDERVRHGGAQLDTVLGSMAEGVLAIDRDRRVLFANRAAREMFGLDQQPLERRPLLEVVRHPEIERVVQEALRDPGPKNTELEFLGKTRRQLLLRVTRLPGDPPPGLVLVFHDVTELRRLERLREDFVANVSHELKTPLAGIKAFAETLLDGAIADPEHNVNFVQRIAGQAQRLEQLIVDLLSLARIESGHEQFDIGPIDVGGIVAERVAAHSPLAEAKRIQVSVQPASESLEALADEEGLREIIDNLLGNAIKYTPEDGRVTVRWRGEAEQLVLDIEDSGIGIPAKDRERIFERFYRVDKARSRALGGTGLGLSIVKHLVQAFGGTVSVSSQPGQGSTFTVRLPLRRTSETTHEGASHG